MRHSGPGGLDDRLEEWDASHLSGLTSGENEEKMFLILEFYIMITF